LEQEMEDQVQARLDKIAALRAAGKPAYAERYERTHTLGQAAALPDGTAGVRLAGRIVALRLFGKLTFGHLFDESGRLQFSFQRNRLGEAYEEFRKIADLGDFVGVEGEMITTRTGEKTIDVTAWTFLAKAVRPMPEKFHGLVDSEQRLRRRYLDLVMTPEVMTRFKKRTEIVRALRAYLDAHGFMEIDTPVLSNKASGALAKPFLTHHNALDLDVYLRIAPETYLKRAVAGGLDRVYEFARCFRNEGMDPSHLPDFTMLEFYASYWNYRDNMEFTEAMVKDLLLKVNGGLEVSYQGTTISFAGDWPRMSFRDLILRDSGIDLDACRDKASLQAAVKAACIDFGGEGVDAAKLGRGALIDQLFKKVSRPRIVNPVFVTEHPAEISPLARRNDGNDLVVDRFQLVVNGWEIVNAYSELIDPVDQRQRLEQQAAARKAGDEEAMELDEDFLLCMEHGMPPMSGFGMGIDRITALLTDATTLRDVVLFPLMRPEQT
jgi:lysyl-tRNA synthetase class 2